MEFTQALRVLADHAYVAEDLRGEVHDAIDAEAAARGEPKREQVKAAALKEAVDREAADLLARLAELGVTVAKPEGA